MRDNKVNVLKKMLGMILVAPVMLSLSLFAADPVHHWKLDEMDVNGSTYLDSVGGADGTCTSPGCPTPTEGQVYGAQSFDDVDDVIEVNGTGFDWNSSASATIEFWMKTSPCLLPSVNDVMIGRSNESDVLQWYVGVDKENALTLGHIRAYIVDGGGSKSGNIPVDNDEWNHIAYVLTPGKLKVYVNGEKDFNISRSGPTDLSHNTNVTIGTLYWLSNNWSYMGQLDDIKLYATDLNGSTIKEHYLNGFKPHLIEVTPVPTPTDNVTPEYTFSSDTNGTIEIGGSCTDAIERNATVGDNTITFDTPDGTYNDCTITVTSTEADTDGNVSDPLAVSSFVVDTYVPTTTTTTTTTGGGGGGGCTYNPDSKNFDMMFLLMITLGLFYPFRRRFIK